MSDDRWQASDLVAPKDRGAIPFAPWFPERQRKEAKPSFNDWNLKRDAELERARLAAEAKALADAEERERAAKAAEAVAPPHMQELSDEELERVRAEAFEQGVNQGREQTLAELAQERERQAVLMQEVLQQWQGFRANTAAWFEPLKRLSLSVGEQLARAQLALKPELVQQLIQTCAETLGETRDHVMVHVNPEDLARLQALDVHWPEEWHWVEDARLSVGSVRLNTEDTEVEDLMAHRLSVLSQQLLNPHLPQVDPNQAQAAVDAPTPEEAATPEAVATKEDAQAVLPREAPISMAERAEQADAVQDVEVIRDEPQTPPASERD